MDWSCAARPIRGGCCEAWAVRRVEGKIVEVEQQEGHVTALRMADGQRVSGELFIDCSGFPLTDVAGWVQLNAQWHPSWITGLGCGTDRVHGSRADRRRNSACAAHASWRPLQPLLMTVEYRRFATRFADGLRRAGHWNVGFGIDL